MAAVIFGNKNRRLDAVEAVAEGVKAIHNETKSAQSFISSAERLRPFPSEEAKGEAMEDMKTAIDCLKAALTAAENVQRNLKRM